MAFDDYADLVRFVYDWQTSIAGILALAGGVLAYRAGVRQAKETRDAADRQILALQEQNADLKRAEQRRLAQESLNAARVLYASMGSVAGVISSVRSALIDNPDGLINEQAANTLRSMIEKYNFDYLREKVGNFDNEGLVIGFQVLERSIAQLRAQRGAIHCGQFRAELDNLWKQVKNLQTDTLEEFERAKTVLSGDELPTHQGWPNLDNQ